MRLVLLQEFDHHTVCGLGMEEGDEAVDALARCLVDQADALGAELVQSLCYVGDGEADVVAAFAAMRQEAGGAAFVVGRGEEFDGAVAGVKKCDFDAVVGRVQAFEETEAEDAAVGGEGVFEVVDDDADVVEMGVEELHFFPFRCLRPGSLSGCRNLAQASPLIHLFLRKGRRI